MNALRHDVHIDVLLPRVKAADRKKLFRVLSEEAAVQTGLPASLLAGGLKENEKVGRSGIGEGVAIPHLKLQNLERPLTIFARLEKTIDYNSQDDEPVDLVCFLLSPEADGPFNLRRLSRLSRLLRNNTLCDQIRQTDDEQEIRILLSHSQDWHMAA